jgi:hypothetical protein
LRQRLLAAAPSPEQRRRKQAIAQCKQRLRIWDKEEYELPDERPEEEKNSAFGKWVFNRQTRGWSRAELADKAR